MFWQTDKVIDLVFQSAVFLSFSTSGALIINHFQAEVNARIQGSGVTIVNPTEISVMYGYVPWQMTTEIPVMYGSEGVNPLIAGAAYIHFLLAH